jgi:Domain of Unknown Function (DUF1080)
MLRCVLLMVVLSSVSIPCFAEPSSSDAPVEKPGMTSLFTGLNLNGWEGDPQLWTVVGGRIRGETTRENPAKGNTFLVWKDGTVKDFELRLSFRCNDSNNSGIQYRSKRITDASAKNNWVVRGYQFELRNENVLPNVSGFIYDEGGKRGRLCLVGERASNNSVGKKEVAETFLDEAAFKKIMRLDDWNDVVIIGKGNQISHYLNGKLIVDFTDDNPRLASNEGVLALQLHAGNPMWVEFKNLRLRKIEADKNDSQKKSDKEPTESQKAEATPEKN